MNQIEVNPIEVKKEELRADSLKELLQREFIQRCRKNPAYSLRAFAKFLGVDPSLLSKVIRGHRNISNENAFRFAGKLGIKPSELKGLMKEKNKPIKAPFDDFNQLTDDQFNFMSDWYHFAIMELIKTKSFIPDEKFIAKRLNIHITEVRAAVERLRRMNFLEITANSWVIKESNNTWYNGKMTNEARRLLQRKLTEKSLQALDGISFDERDHSSLTVAVSKKRMPEFKEKLTEFRRSLNHFFQEDDEFDEVYQLTVALFPLTEINKK